MSLRAALRFAPRGLPRLLPQVLPRVLPQLQRGQCRLGLSRDVVAVLRSDGSRSEARRIADGATDGLQVDSGAAASAKPLPLCIERALTDAGPNAAPDELAALIGDAIDQAGGGGLPIHATFGDDLVRYFIVTPPANGARFQDLRTAAEVRFQTLYGESAAAWRLVADWQASTPFLACAVPLRLHVALQIAARARRSCVVSSVPDFVGAWNRWHRRVKSDAWLATLHAGALTVGVLDGSARRARLAAVRTLTLVDPTPPLAWLREQLARTALLDNVPAPKVLHVHGQLPDSWQLENTALDKAADRRANGGARKNALDATNSGEDSAANSPINSTVSSPASCVANTGANKDNATPETGIAVRACSPALAVFTASHGTTVSPAAQLAWSGIAR
ncbi:hypothetical protein BX592_15210 [Paraburkholderia rhizosphaerae]|uniref:Uncharacterized protein n=2 Tax=Paraburkholderia rhizosphaerae TaxID=480658 RepID=A0A4R8KP24_9BURK|nr:hypothetical protein BX592_15210 [Paraburkholderia rhizosphaerae]